MSKLAPTPFFLQKMSTWLSQQTPSTANNDKATSTVTPIDLERVLNSDISAPFYVNYSLDTYLPVEQLSATQHYNIQENTASQTILFNDLLGKNLRITWHEQIFCKRCGSQTKKSYSQGYCYLCFKKSASCDLCMMNPHTCHFHLNTCREPEWAQSVCFQPHIVYLSYTSAIKVGITKVSQVPTRWIDQGALMALPIAKTSSRRLAGMIENQLTTAFTDKTNWRTMLKMAYLPDASELSEQLLAHALPAKQQLMQLIDTIKAEHTYASDDEVEWFDNTTAIQLVYPTHNDLLVPANTPMNKIPIKSLNLEKSKQLTGKLLAIKGQYLIFDTGVINIRKYSQYLASVEIL